MRLLAREAVLREELDSTEASIPRQLLDLVDEKQAKALINSQIGERKTVEETNVVLERQQAQVIDSAKRALDVKTDEMKLVDDAIDARDRRLKTMESMTSKGLVGDPLLQAAKAEYLDTLARKQELIAATEQSQTQITDAQSKLAKLKLDTRYALQHELTQLELQIQQQSAVYRAHLAVAGMINDDPNFSPGGAPLEFDLIRRIGDRIETRRVQGACLLQPGDLVRIRLASPEPNKN